MSKIGRLTQKAKEHLESDETIHAVLLGQYEIKLLGQDSIRRGIFIATDHRVVFFAKKLIGYDVEVLPYSNISSIEMSKGIMGYSIAFFVSGNKAKMKWIQNKKKEVQQFVEFVRQHIGKKQPSEQAPKQDQSSNIVEQIKELAELKDQGILDEEEFQTKKKDLLVRI